MSLKPQIFDPVPDETSRVAKAAFPNGNVYMQMRDAFGALYADEAFAPLFSPRGQPGAAPACLALVTVMQFAEGLSDRQAANAVRGHIDWKYALGLELTDPGFDASVLSEFRSRLIAGQAEAQLFELMLTRFREAGLLKARGQQRTDSTHVLGAIHTLNRLECVGETLRRALNVLAVVAPDWLRAQVPPEWFDRYSRRFENYRLPPGKPERYALAETIGADGFQLLRWVYATTTPAWVRQIPAVEVLRQVWLQQFYASEQAVRWRVADDLPEGRSHHHRGLGPRQVPEPAPQPRLQLPLRLPDHFLAQLLLGRVGDMQAGDVQWIVHHVQHREIGAESLGQHSRLLQDRIGGLGEIHRAQDVVDRLHAGRRRLRPDGRLRRPDLVAGPRGGGTHGAPQEQRDR